MLLYFICNTFQKKVDITWLTQYKQCISSTGTYAIIGTMCVESETCYEKYHEKKKNKHDEAV